MRYSWPLASYTQQVFYNFYDTQQAIDDFPEVKMAIVAHKNE